MVAMPGASSGQTGRTGQGAWSMTSRLAGPRLRGSQAGTVAVAGRDDQPGAFGRGDRDQGIPARRQRIGSAAAMVKTARVI
jgi:hypothetical protein